MILDEPPQREHIRWTKERIQWYKRYAPNAARHDAAPLLPDNSFAERLAFEDEASNNIWKALLGSYDLDAMIHLNSLISSSSTTTTTDNNPATTQQ